MQWNLWTPICRDRRRYRGSCRDQRWPGIGGVTEVPAEIRNGSGGGGGWGGRSQGDGIDV